MATTPLPETVRQVLGPDAARDLANWLEQRLQTPDPPISAFVARQKINVLMLEQISHLLLADDPELVMRADRTWVWRVPIDFTYPSRGRVGRVGEMEVDAQHGEVRYTTADLDRIRMRTQQMSGQSLSSVFMSGRHAFPHFQQSRDGYCLSACARMVLTYLGDHLSEAEVSQALEAHDFGAPSACHSEVVDARISRGLSRMFTSANARIAASRHAVDYLRTHGVPGVLDQRRGARPGARECRTRAIVRCSRSGIAHRSSNSFMERPIGRVGRVRLSRCCRFLKMITAKCDDHPVESVTFDAPLICSFGLL